MARSIEPKRRLGAPALLCLGFRPFFLAGAVTATIVPIVTMLVLSGALEVRFANNILAWHSHEMVYGYLGAVIAGFVLTAVPNWTGRSPLIGVRLALLVAVWLAGRVTMILSVGSGSLIIALVDGSFLFLLAAIMWHEVLAGKNLRNAPVCVLISLLAVGNASWHFEFIRGANNLFGLHFGIAIIAILLALIGGRVTPSFTRNWLTKSGRDAIDVNVSTLDKLALGALAFSLSMWLFIPGLAITGGMLFVAGVLHFARLARWQGWRAAAEPLVLILHIGYFWLALSIMLLGISGVVPNVIPSTTALHALTTGAMGVMTLAVMTRAARGHTGRPLTADVPTILIFILVNIGAIVRVTAIYWPMPYVYVTLLSSLVWAGAFALFTIVYGRYLLTPRLLDV